MAATGLPEVGTLLMAKRCATSSCRCGNVVALDVRSAQVPYSRPVAYRAAGASTVKANCSCTRRKARLEFEYCVGIVKRLLCFRATKKQKAVAGTDREALLLDTPTSLGRISKRLNDTLTLRKQTCRAECGEFAICSHLPHGTKSPQF